MECSDLCLIMLIPSTGLAGSSSAVPLPTSKSIWTLFASSVVLIVFIEQVVLFAVIQCKRLRVPFSWPASFQLPQICFSALLLSIILRAVPYSIVASLVVLFYFVHRCMRLQVFLGSWAPPPSSVRLECIIICRKTSRCLYHG
jgi:hypothetical protein